MSEEEDEDDELDELGMLEDELLDAPALALSFELPHAARPSGRARARAAMVLRRAVLMV
jgi:hypothetical protein